MRHQKSLLILKLEIILNGLDGLLNSKRLVPWMECNISNAEMDIVNNPTSLFGKKNTPYILLVNDNKGETIFGGGISFIIGYTYKNDDYGTQLVMRYSNKTIRVRNKYNGVWGNFS